MSDIHFTKNYQLEAIRAELQKVLGSISGLVASAAILSSNIPPSPIPIDTSVAEPFEMKGSSTPTSMIRAANLIATDLAAANLAAQAADKAVHEAQAATYDAAATTVTYVSEPCSMTSSDKAPEESNARVAAYQKEILEMERSHKAAIAEMQDSLTKTQDRYTSAEMARIRTAEMFRISREKLAEEQRQYERVDMARENIQETLDEAQKALADYDDRLAVVEASRQRTEALLVEARALSATRLSNLQQVSRRYSIAVLKLNNINALFSDSGLTSKPTPVESH